MTPAELLDEASHRGVRLFVVGSELRFRAPRGALTPELKAALVEHKSALLELLGRPAAPPRPANLTVGELERLEERAGILEFDAGLSRSEAEAEALRAFLARPEQARGAVEPLDGTVRLVKENG